MRRGSRGPRGGWAAESPPLSPGSLHSPRKPPLQRRLLAKGRHEVGTAHLGLPFAPLQSDGDFVYYFSASPPADDLPPALRTPCRGLPCLHSPGPSKCNAVDKEKRDGQQAEYEEDVRQKEQDEEDDPDQNGDEAQNLSDFASDNL